MKKQFLPKLLAMLLVAFIGILPQLPALATMYDGEVELNYSGDGEPIYNAFEYKDEIYSLADNVLLKQKGDSTEFVGIAKLQYEKEILDSEGEVLEPQGNMVVDGETLYFISYKGIFLAELNDKVVMLKELLPLKEDDEQGYLDTHNARIIDGKLYLIHSSNEGENSLMVYTLGENSPKTYRFPEEAGYLSGFGKYKDGVFIVSDSGLQSFDGANFNQIFNFEEGVYPEGSNIVYIESEDSFYFVNGSYLMRIQNGKAEPITVLNSIPHFLLLLHDGRIFLSSAVDAEFLDPKTAKMPEKVLKVTGLEDQRIIRTYNKLHPEMPAVRAYNYPSDAVAYTNAMKGEEKADVYVSDIFYYVDDLIRHEFIEPLNDDAELKALYDRMYPYVQKVISKDDKIYLMPYNVFSYNTSFPFKIGKYAYNTKIWESLGLSEQDVPKTYAQFVQLLDRIHSEHHEDLQADNTPILPYPSTLSYELKLRALNLCIINAKQNGTAPKFDTPEMNELLNTIDKSEYMEATRDDAFLNELGYSEFPLFKETEDVIDLPIGYVPFNLTIGENDQPYTLASSTVAFVNALSENKTEAKAFLRHMMSELALRNQTYLYTDLNEPVESKDTQKYLAIQEKLLQKLEAEIEADKAQGGKNVKRLEQEKEDNEMVIRRLKERTMLLSAEEIAVLNQDAPYILILTDNPFDWNNEQMSTLMQRLYQNDMPTKEFLSELDRIVNMMQMEGR